MELIGKGLGPGDEGALSRVVVLGPILTEVDGAVHDAGRGPDQLHDVDFAAGWPADRWVVGAEHPDGRPDALALGQDGADVDAPVLEFLQSDGLHAGRGVLGTAVPCDDEEIAPVHIGVLAAVGVVLQLLVAPAAGTEVVGPVGEVDGLAVEFIGPHEGLAGITRGGQVALVGHREQAVVIADGANGLLDAASEDGVGGSRQHEAELFIFLEVRVHHNVHENRRGCGACRDDEGILYRDVVLSLDGRQVPRLIPYGDVPRGALIEDDGKLEGAVGFSLVGTDVDGESDLGDEGRRVFRPALDEHRENDEEKDRLEFHGEAGVSQRYTSRQALVTATRPVHSLVRGF